MSADIRSLVARAKRQLDDLYRTDPTTPDAYETAVSELESTLNLIDQAAAEDTPTTEGDL